MSAKFRYKLIRLGLCVLALLLAIVIVRELAGLRENKTANIDFDSDNIPEQVILDNGVFQIWKQGNLIFASDPAWQVTAYAFGDSNNDGLQELNLGFWRTGDYGVQDPYSQNRRDPLPGYHLYLYRYQPETQNFRLLWGSSTLNDPLVSLKVTANTDNVNYLTVETGTYADFDKNGSITPVGNSDWVWDNWWFKIVA